MKALYIGYSKTGTKTMNAVFEMLGYKCYDYEENFFYLGKEWRRILDEGSNAEDFRRMYEDVDAAVDTPVYIFWEEILEAFPNVKLLVSFREEESWLKSVLNQREKIVSDKKMQIMSMLSPTAQKYMAFCRLLGNRIWGNDRNAWPWQTFTDYNPTLSKLSYRKHNNNIKQKAMELGDQLHVVNYNEGWEPICKFLGEPIPNEPFPHENKAGSFLKKYMATSPIFLRMKSEMRNLLSASSHDENKRDSAATVQTMNKGKEKNKQKKKTDKQIKQTKTWQ